MGLKGREAEIDEEGEVKLYAGNKNRRGPAFNLAVPVDDTERWAARLSDQEP